LLDSFVHDFRHIGSGACSIALASKVARYLPGQVGGRGNYVCLQNGARDIQEPSSPVSLRDS
jgi:hypothetical protein